MPACPECSVEIADAQPPICPGCGANLGVRGSGEAVSTDAPRKAVAPHFVAISVVSAILYVSVARDCCGQSGNAVYLQIYWPIFIPFAFIPGTAYYLVVILPFVSYFQGQGSGRRWLCVPVLSLLTCGFVGLIASGGLVETITFGLMSLLGSATYLALQVPLEQSSSERSHENAL
jgi:hypothetical protein